ncbi:MAG TPA: porin [Nitrospirota bacterium]
MKEFRLLVYAVIVWAVFLGYVNVAHAEEDAAVTAPSTVEEKIDALEQKIKVLERLREVDDEKSVDMAKGTAVVSAGKDGFSISSPDKDFVLKFRGLVQADGRYYLSDRKDKATDSFLLRRVRPIFEGTIYNWIDFRIMPDFGGGTAVLQDAYIDLKFAPEIAFRAGKFKTPFGLERLQDDANAAFIESGIANANLTPNREVGFQLSGELFKKATYAVGVFTGNLDGGSNDSDVNDEKDFAGRVFVTPFKGEDIPLLEGLGFGIGGTFGKNDVPAATLANFKYSSAGQQKVFNYLGTVAALGYHYRWSPQAYYYYGPFGIQGEFDATSQEFKAGTKQANINNTGYQVTGSYVITGEDASYRGVKTKKPFNLSTGDFGAIEAVTRYGQLRIDPQAFPKFADAKVSVKQQRDYGVGLNWYLNNSLRFSVTYDQTKFLKGAAGRLDRADEKIVISRLQLYY